MPTQGIIVSEVNFTELKEALAIAPIETWRFAKTELDRFSKRVRRKTIQGMSGKQAVRGPSDQFGRAKGQTRSGQAKAPSEALYGGQFKRGKHIQGFATGGDLGSLKAVSKISRILRVHEEGATISKKGPGFLFLSRKTAFGAAPGRIFSHVKSVTIPPRLHFMDTWNKEIPDGSKRVMDGIHRAMRVVLDRRMKAITSTVQSLTSL